SPSDRNARGGGVDHGRIERGFGRQRRGGKTPVVPCPQPSSPDSESSRGEDGEPPGERGGERGGEPCGGPCRPGSTRQLSGKPGKRMFDNRFSRRWLP